MTPEAALHSFFSGFGLPAYAATSVPDDAELPYLTYELSTGAFGDAESPVYASIWYRTTSEAVPNAKAREVSEAIGMGGVMLPCDGGAVWLKRSAPFSQSMADDTDSGIKRRYLLMTAEFETPF